jgi:hypothetical protein
MDIDDTGKKRDPASAPNDHVALDAERAVWDPEYRAQIKRRLSEKAKGTKAVETRSPRLPRKRESS